MSDKMDDFINREAKGYQAGSKPPADDMWSAIELDVARAIKRQPRGISRHWPWLAATAGIAAALVIGVAIGRESAGGRREVGGAAPTASSLQPPDSALATQRRALTLAHFVQAEIFLTEVRADLKTGRQDPQREERSRELLARTRLLMANDAGGAPAVDRLLQALELVLAEISALPPDSANKGRSIDTRLLDERLRVGSVLPRIRTILPAPATVGGAE